MSVPPTHWLISTQAARATIGFRTAAAGHDFQDWPIVERKLPTEYDKKSGEFKFEDGDGLCGNQPVRRVLGNDAAVLSRSSGEELASPRHRAGVASMAWRTTR